MLIAERIKKRLKTGYCDFMVNSLDEALRILKNAIRKKEAISVGLVGNCADVHSRTRASAASSPTSSLTRPPRTIR